MTDHTLREASLRDAPAIAELLFAASYHDALVSGLAPLLADVRAARDVVAALGRTEPLGGVLAEVGGEPVAAGWACARGRVGTVGPVVVAPAWRGRGLGTAVLEGLLDRVRRGAAQIRMIDGGAQTGGIGLGLRSGFHVLAPVLCLGLPGDRSCAVDDLTDGTMVRPATPDDRWAIVERDGRFFGARREPELDDAFCENRVVVAERAGRVVGHAIGSVIGSTLVLGTAAAEDPDVVMAMVAMQVDIGRPTGGPVRMLVPGGDQRLVDVAWRAGFRVERLHALLTHGGGSPPPKGYVLSPFGGC